MALEEYGMKTEESETLKRMKARNCEEYGMKTEESETLKRMKARNCELWSLSQKRIEGMHRERARKEIQVIEPEVNQVQVPNSIKCLIEKLKRFQGEFSLFHFNLQMGRLRIEFSSAKGNNKKR